MEVGMEKGKNVQGKMFYKIFVQGREKTHKPKGEQKKQQQH